MKLYTLAFASVLATGAVAAHAAAQAADVKNLVGARVADEMPIGFTELRKTPRLHRIARVPDER